MPNQGPDIDAGDPWWVVECSDIRTTLQQVLGSYRNVPCLELQ